MFFRRCKTTIELIVNTEFTGKYVFMLPGVLLKEEWFISCHAKTNLFWVRLITNMFSSLYWTRCVGRLFVWNNPVKFVSSLLSPERFFDVYYGFLLSSKTIILLNLTWIDLRRFLVPPISRAMHSNASLGLRSSEYSYYDDTSTIKFNVCYKIQFTQGKRLSRELRCRFATGEAFKINADIYHVLYPRE